MAEGSDTTSPCTRTAWMEMRLPSGLQIASCRCVVRRTRARARAAAGERGSISKPASARRAEE
eukprot:14121537-Alexandrium_andersonii.AAC.1